MDPAGAGTTTSRPEGDAVRTDIDPADPPRLRRECVALIRNGHGAVLLVKPNYKSGWQLPGGHAQEGEPSAVAAARSLKGETGLVRQLSHVLLVDDVPASDEERVAAGIALVFDGGTLTNDSLVKLPEEAREGLSGVKWVSPQGIDGYTHSCEGRRIRAAISCADQGMRAPAHTLGSPAPA
ncbi:NUDIX domain-containing protein [Streptomyces sp. MNP-20]|uniref:NUDIX domain-containing protein n=1 Tax=Streptomyces sp. MNP-20 TaxID=2721165 RepID=UPI0035C7BDC8